LAQAYCSLLLPGKPWPKHLMVKQRSITRRPLPPVNRFVYAYQVIGLGYERSFSGCDVVLLSLVHNHFKA